jgi:hypothetical protein
MSSFQIKENANAEAEKPRRITDRVTQRHISHIFAGVTRAGEASRRPYEEKFKCRGACAYNVRDFVGLAVFVDWEVA